MNAEGIVPIFPLPGAVLYPATVLPLHVFEARYREMVRDAIAGDELIALALLRPGYEEEYADAPPIHTVATVGRISNFELLDDGRSTFHLVGLQRVDLDEIASEHTYRVARYTIRPEIPVDEYDPDVERARLELFATHNLLMTELSEAGAAPIAVDAGLPYEAVVNGACANLPVDAELRQHLLEVDDLQQRQREASEHLQQTLERVMALKNESGGPAN